MIPMSGALDAWLYLLMQLVFLIESKDGVKNNLETLIIIIIIKMTYLLFN